MRGCTKRYAGVLALDAVDFSMAAGEVRALLGKNGAGKSTLIRLLTGAERADSGEIAVCGEPVGSTRHHASGVQAVYQELSLVPSMSVMENMFLGDWPRRGVALDHRAMRQRTREALARLGLDGIDPDQWVESLSAAERQLVEIARALMGHPRLVILDEPTSSLTERESRTVIEAVRRISAEGIAVIYVSHRMKEIREIAHSATVLRNGRASGPHSLDAMDDEQIVQLMLGQKEPRAAEVATQQQPGKAALAVRGLRVAPKLLGIDLELRHGEVLGLAGLLGCGRSELLRALAGVDPVQAGELEIQGRRYKRWHYRRLVAQGLGFTPENRKEEGIFPLLGVDENIVLSDIPRVSRQGVVRSRRVRECALAVIRSMNLVAAAPEVPINTLSGGNQQKAVIGRWAHAESAILLLDEPTRGVDVEAKFQIYAIMRRLAEAGKSVIFVSSELEELPLVCDRVLVLRGGRIASELRAPELTVNALVAACMFDRE